MIPWRSHLLLPTVTAPTPIVVAAPALIHPDGETAEPYIIGIYEAHPDGRIEGEDIGTPPNCPHWYWAFEADVVAGMPTYKVAP